MGFVHGFVPSKDEASGETLVHGGRSASPKVIVNTRSGPFACGRGGAVLARHSGGQVSRELGRGGGWTGDFGRTQVEHVGTLCGKISFRPKLQSKVQEDDGGRLGTRWCRAACTASTEVAGTAPPLPTSKNDVTVEACEVCASVSRVKPQKELYPFCVWTAQLF